MLALVLVAASFLIQGSVGLNLADEGYLWHSVMRVLQGDVPMRDFQSYDPGRYYWSAAWMRLFGNDGIVALRVSVALFQAGGLAAGLLMLRRVIASRSAFVVAALVLLLWCFPRHKLFDLSLSMLAVYAGMALLERPSLARHFAAGAYVGMAAVFGRNHGVYAAVALSALALLAWRKLDRARAGAKLLMLGTGTLAGYSPMLVLALVEPGFLQAVVESVLQMWRNGATNLAIPVPWPWALDLTGLPPAWMLHRLFVSLAFVVMPMFYLAALLALLRARDPQALRRNSVLVAASVVGAVYAHYAFARADVGHLAHAILPFLLALLSLPAALRLHPRMELRLALVLCAASIFAAGMVSPWYLTTRMNESARIDVRGDTLLVDSETARAVQAVQEISRTRMGPGEQIVFAPYWPTMYGVIGRTAPVWETYSTSLSSDAKEQQRFIDQLERARVEWVLAGDPRLDNREDRRFSHTHPLTWAYLRERFDTVPVDGLPADYRLLRRRAAGPVPQHVDPVGRTVSGGSSS